MSVVRLAERKGRVLRLEGIDVLDGTPLIEMKPRVSSFGHRADVRMGWPRGKA
jgi:formylmethanofuran dehydrogenase subunit E